MNKTVFGIVIVLAILVVGWYFFSPGTFMGVGIEKSIQPPVLPE